MWPFKSKRKKRIEHISQLLYGIGIALVIFFLPIFLRAYLVISISDSISAIILGIIFLLAGLIVSLKE